MFTGIVEQACPVSSADRRQGRLSLEIDLAALRAEPSGPLVGSGDSVAINGVCLTVSTLSGDRARFDVIPETLACTALGDLLPGARVNVERALRFGQRVDGHLVQGHVERTGRIDSLEERDGELRMGVCCGADFARRCLPKGSVCLDGVSLTVAELLPERLVVALVPHTLEVTTLGDRRVDDALNLEPDMIGQWVLRQLEGSGALGSR